MNKNEKKQFQIESDIPIPHLYNRGKHSFPFLSLKKGQSFILNKNEQQSLRVQIRRYQIANPECFKHYTIRKIGENEYRCWRIS